MLFSVVIPVYNTEKYLKKCIKSVIDQKHNKTEIILVEDHSKDSSLKVCNSFEDNPSIKIIRHRKNLGVSITRNDGIRAAKGKYILFLDSDDWLYPGSLIEIEKIITQKPKTDVIIGRYNSDGFPFSNEILFKNSNSNYYSKNRFFSYINKINFRPMVIWHFIVKKSLIKKNKIYFLNVQNGEDEEFGVRLLCTIKSLSLVSKNYYWHKHRKKGHLRYARDIKSTDSYIRILVEYYKYISKTNLSSNELKFIHECIRFAYGEVSSRIILHTKIELNELNFKLRSYLKNSKISLNKIKNNNINSLFKNKNILQNKDLIEKNLLEKINSIKFKFNEIYIYCAAIHGIATLNILQHNKFEVSALIDDNLKIEKQTHVNLNIITGNSFLKTKKDLSKVIILVCQPTFETFYAIRKKLKLKGIKNNQIVHVTF